MIDDNFFGSLPSTDDVAADVTAFLTGAGRPGTLAHIRAVVAQAARLAERFGANIEAATTAAWCHDMAAVVPHDRMVAVASAWRVPLTEADLAVVPLIHGPLAAEVARQRLRVASEDTLNAIRYHSTLRAGSSLLEKIVFTADKIALDPRSPRNDFLPALKAAWRAGESIDALAFVYVDWVIRHESELGWTIHRNLRAAWHELKAGL